MPAGEIRWNLRAKKLILLKSNNISANIDSVRIICLVKNA